MNFALNTTPAAGPLAGDTVSQQLQQLMAMHSSDYSRTDALMQFVQLGMAHQRYDTVEAYLVSFIGKGANVASLYHLVATVQEKQGKFIEGAQTIRSLFETRDPKTEAMYEEAGKILLRTGKLDDLEYCLRLMQQGCREFPENLDMIQYQAEALMMLDRHEEVVSLFEEAVRQRPYEDVLHFVLGLTQLTVSHLTDGFTPYRHRFNLPSFRDNMPFLPWEEWQGEPLKGKKLYLCSEQGVGDIVMWSGLLPWLASQGGDVTCAVPPKMLPLLRRSIEGITFVEKELILPKKQLLANFDYCLPMGHLMEYVLPHYKPAEHVPSFLKADKDAVARKRAEYLAHKPGATRLVGLSWHSAAKNGWRRNIPLDVMHPLLQDPNTVYVSLQYNQQLDDVDFYNQKYGASHGQVITDYSFIPMEDFDTWASQHAAMDQVYSIQNSSVHLAGALGVPTTIFLPTYGAFHWGHKQTSNYWYRSVTICQQTLGQSWESLIKAYAQDHTARRP